ncbi:MAG: hypothetical protein F6K11_18735 [Leptolyngbya sp. SIO3F4]|nr:hypothetical protein [Leptolyngbya sp. SIO3F4]
MELDKEQQARQTFLAEAETYFGEIETVLLGLRTADDHTAQINIAMRAAHSVKGTAGMMGFGVLSQVAHNIEEAFKILRARQLSVDTHLETLLLQGVDCLRVVRQQYHDQQPIDPQWLDNEVEPIFAQLQQRLGELTPEDEARLLSEDNNENLDFVIFTTSVDDTLEEFEEPLSYLEGDELRQSLITLARQMTEFGLMAQLDSFVSLCQSVEQQCMLAQSGDIREIASQAMKTWRRCHSLVLLGRTERLPSELKPGQNRPGEEGQAIGYCCLQATTADFARLGEFYRLDGVWNGERLLPEGWVEMATVPGEPWQEPGETPYEARGYAMHFWMPEDYNGEFFAAGVFGQYVWVDTLRGVVIAQNAGNPDWDAMTRETYAAFRAIAEHVSPAEMRLQEVAAQLRDAIMAREAGRIADVPQDDPSAAPEDGG